MNITRHNYEEYFILYIDNELSSDGRRMVEAFIAQHPDLKEELELLQQFKLEPDTAVTYTGKEELMKIDGSSPVTLTNYDEWLSLYIDNELTAEQKVNVEKFLAENPAINAELSLYKRSKLQPETIIFSHKESLFRKEEKVHRITPIWWRVAAAVLLVIVATTVVLVNNKSGGSKDDIAKTLPGTEKPTTPVQLPEQTTTENPVAVVEEKNTVAPENTNTKNDALKQNNNVATIKNSKSSPKNKMQKNLTAPLKKEETAIVVTNNDKPNNNLPKPLNNPNIVDINTAQKAITSVDIPAKSTSKNDVLTNTGVTSPKLQPSNSIVAASFTNTNEQLEEPDGKKNKLRGFLRKVTRTFEKRTNIEATDDDGKLLVAGLAIKLK